MIQHRKEHKEETKEYNKEWYLKNKEKYKEERHNYAQMPKSIFGRLSQTAKRKNLPICPKEEFINWYEKQEKICVYCDIPVELLKPLEWGRKHCRNRLTIERINNSKGYLIDNICLACDICNRSKNEDMVFKEMKQLGQSVKKIWQKRFK